MPNQLPNTQKKSSIGTSAIAAMDTENRTFFLSVEESVRVHPSSTPHFPGSYKKDYPESMLRAFDPEYATIICIDPPGYGTSRPPDRKQEVNRCKMDAAYCIKLMEKLKLTPFAVLGWSEGGRTAIHVGGQGKSLVSHMMLLATSTRVDFRGDMAFKGKGRKGMLKSSFEAFKVSPHTFL